MNKKTTFLHAQLVYCGKKSKIYNIGAFLSSHGKVAMNFAVWKHCNESFTYVIPGICWKFFCATVNAQIVSAQTVIVLDLLELGWLFEEKRIDASGAPYPFQSILMVISIHMVPYCFLTNISFEIIIFFATPVAIESKLVVVAFFYSGKVLIIYQPTIIEINFSYNF